MDSQDTIRTISLDALTELLQIVGPEQPITVRGIVREINYWTKPGDSEPTRLYGRLEQGSTTIRFELPPQAGLRNGEAVVLHGVLRIKPAKDFRTTHEVLLNGDVVGNWVPRKQDSEAPVRLERSRPRIALESIVDKHGISSIAFLTTDTAWQDLLSAAKSIAKELQNCRRITTSFVKAEQFTKDAKALFDDPKIAAIVVARGGAEGVDTVDESPLVVSALLSSERPFYAALGHDKHVHLMDRYADGTYPTPSIAGAALAEAEEWRSDQQDQAQREYNLFQENESLAAVVDNLKRERDALAQAQVSSPQPQPSSHWTNARYFTFGAMFVIALFLLLNRCSG